MGILIHIVATAAAIAVIYALFCAVTVALAWAITRFCDGVDAAERESREAAE